MASRKNTKAENSRDWPPLMSPSLRWMNRAPAQNGELHPCGDARQQADGEHQPAHEVGQRDVVEHADRDEPGEIHPLEQVEG
jgi:hypothetical protein